MGKKSSPPVPATNQRWWALITNSLWTGGDDPSYHQRLKSNAPQTGGDAHFKPAVMGGAGVVNQEKIEVYQSSLLANIIVNY